MFLATNNKSWNSKWPQKCEEALFPMSNIPKWSASRCRAMGVFSTFWTPFSACLPQGVAFLFRLTEDVSSSFTCHSQARQHPQRDEGCILLKSPFIRDEPFPEEPGLS